MTKCQLAAEFFQKLGDGSTDFITGMIEEEMSADLVEVFNKFGGRIEKGDMDPSRFQTSLMIIGYLLRAHEDLKVSLDEMPSEGLLH